MKTSKRITTLLLFAALLGFGGCQVADPAASEETLTKRTLPGGVGASLVQSLGTNLKAGGLNQTQINGILAGASSAVINGGANDSTDLLVVAPLIQKGAQGSLSTADVALSTDAVKLAAINLILDSLVTSVSTQVTAKQASVEGVYFATTATFTDLLTVLSAAMVANLDEAGLSDVVAAASSAIDTMAANLATKTIASTQYGNSIKAISKGAVSALDDAGVSKASLSDAVNKMVKAAVTGLKKTGAVNNTQLAAAAAKATAGAVSGLTDAGVASADISSYATTVKAGANAGLTAAGLSATEVTAAATAIDTATTTATATAVAAATTTSTAVDTTAPTLSSLSPADAATAVAPNTTIVLTFSEPMKATTVVTSTDASCSAAVQLSKDNFVTCIPFKAAATADSTNKIFTFTPAANLAYNTNYKVKVTTAVQDTAGNGMAAIKSSSSGFTTAAAPSVSSHVPASNATGISKTAAITVTLSAAIDSTTVTSSNLTIKDASGTAQTGTVGVSGSTITYTPSSFSAGKVYTVTLGTGIKDTHGYPLQTAVSFSFTTLNKVTKMALGDNHTCALKENGTITCWGSNGFGQLGNGTITDSSSPVSVTGLTETVVDLAAGGNHTCAVMTSGSVKCWGAGVSGQIGNGANTNVNNTPTAVSLITTASKVSAGVGFTCSTDQNGLKCWGLGTNGSLGHNAFTSSNVPVGVSGGGVALPTSYTAIASGKAHTCAISSGSVLCWGSSSVGQVGYGAVSGTTPNFIVSANPQKFATPVNFADVRHSQNFSQVVGGQTHSCGITTGGAVYCWGQANRAGNGSSSTLMVLNTLQLASVQATGIDGTVGTATHLAAGKDHTCAVLSDGTIKCWGDNASSQMGNGTASVAYTPTPVSNISTASKVYSGGNHSCATTTDFKVYCWGLGTSGQIGDGGISTRTTPRLITP